MRLTTLGRLGAVLAVAALALPAQAQTFSSSDFIAVPNQTTTSGPALTYPSVITLTGRTGTITDLDVRINALEHTSPSDIGLLLVGPGGENIVLMNGDGGSADVANVTLTFNDAAVATTLPTPLVTGSYKPKGGTASPPAPAPAPSGSTALSVFNGLGTTSLNGAWRLFAFDTATGNYGSLVGNWSLLVTTTTTAQFTQSGSGQIYVPALTTAAGAGGPYPSAITVSGVSGNVLDLNVTLSSLTHSFPSDVNALLVGPAGQSIVLMGGNGGGTDVGGISLTLDDEAGAALPATLVTGSFRPKGGALAGTIPAGTPTASGSTALSTFDGTNPNGVWNLYVYDSAGGDIGAVSGGWSLTFAPLVPSSLALSRTSLNLPAGGPCIFGAGVGFNSTVNLTNSGNTPGGNVTVTGGTFSGPGSASFGFSPAPAFPIVINTSGAAVPIQIVFGPPAGTTGPQNATLTLTFTAEGGPAQTTTIALSGSADAEGAGFVFRGSLSDPACSNNASLPGTAFVDIAGHTLLAAATTDDGVETVNLTASFPTFGPFRMFGIDYTGLQVSSNGTVALGATAQGAALPASFLGNSRSATTPAPPAVPVLIAANLIQAAAADYDLTTTTYDSADPGQYPVGVYIGLADADADGASDDLVVTWYHAYLYGSTSYATPSTAQYHTVQLVLIQSPRANQEDYAEVRYIDGNDPLGTPYRVNTNVDVPGDFYTTTIEAFVTTAITEATASEGALYRLQGGSGGPLYDATAGNEAVRFQAEVQAVATGQRGYRMMGVPVRNYTVGRLAGINLVQRVTGQFPTAPGPNLYTGYDGTSYTAATNVTNALTPGRGFFWLLYNQDITASTIVAGFGAGTSNSYTLPMNLEGTGAETTVSGPIAVTLSTAGDKFNLVANPFRDDLDVSTLGSWATGGALASNVPQVWNPNIGGSGSYDVVTGSLSTWQGFFIENNTATGLLVPTNARNVTGTFLGRDGSLYSNTASATLAFELTGTDAASGQPTVDRAAYLAVRAEDATDGWDVWDASKLSPLATAYATVAFQGERDGSPRLKAQDSRALDATSFDVPLVVDAVGTEPNLTLSWAGLSALPQTWAIELRDVVTGATVDLRTTESYTFEQAASAARPDTDDLVAATTTAAQNKAGDTPRFVLHVTTGRTTAGEGQAVTEFALAAPAPNPTATSTAITFDVPAASDVDVSVYDLLGRRVATLAQGQTAAGRHTVRLDAGSLAPGVYVVRMSAGTFLAIRRVTVVR